jgi:hypothetical protein
MVVNAAGGGAGALMAAGVGLWRGPPSHTVIPFRIGAAAAFHLTSLAFLVMSLMTYVWSGLEVPPPIWAGAPLAFASLVLMAVVRSECPAPCIRHVCMVIAWITLPFALYPVIPHVTPLVFH